MQTKKLFFLGTALTSIVLISFVFNGCKKTEAEMRIYSFKVFRGNSPLSNSSVSIPTKNQYYSAFTDNDGNCNIDIPNGVTLPTYVIVNIDHNSIKPYALSVSGTINTKTSSTLNCQNVPSKVIVRESTLHHLGNDLYDGSANSQLQLSTEGIEKTFSFNLTNIPATMPYLQIYARGVQFPVEIKLNGITTDRLGNSPSNGDLGKWDAQLTANPKTVLRIGNNVLTIKTGASNVSDPWDDIEFGGLLLYY